MPVQNSKMSKTISSIPKEASWHGSWLPRLHPGCWKDVALSLSNTVGWVWRKTGKTCHVWYACGPWRESTLPVALIPTGCSVSFIQHRPDLLRHCRNSCISLACAVLVGLTVYLIQGGGFYKRFQNGSIKYILFLIWITQSSSGIGSSHIHSLSQEKAGVLSPTTQAEANLYKRVPGLGEHLATLNSLSTSNEQWPSRGWQGRYGKINGSSLW